ncbi:hypothetical protein IscW_ISCW002767 [Ixodes scapularis]|uniref:SLC41A/MgtE integral membrane domain-containing protein n=1 Tax=Ixodes scapularis TaxID=6945 RepID=B7PB03_IXOSC|nr:hypothetical protein IscW_ISCW002767 [Ixodes scapularis]|eukprot:XP_002407590.1 hypothetical protein IscW_ISCW002767 [Ixodes scapularis]
MVSVVVLSKFCRVNPDNVSISIAAALGDVVTVGLLACVSAAIFHLLVSTPCRPRSTLVSEADGQGREEVGGIDARVC